ncbi:MAG TPA: MopE-related protein, partial [Polyangiales bacterium]
MDARTPSGPDTGTQTVPDPDGSRPGTLRASRIVSMPPNYVVVGDSYRYRVKASTKSAGLEMDGAPTGMQVRGNMIEWTPTEQQAGTHTMTVRSQAASGAAAQEITLNVAQSTLRAADDVDPEAGGSVYSDSPQSTRMLGAGVYVPPRAISAATRMTVSELDSAPSTPNAAGRTRAVRFGPEGQTFDAPARVTLPLPEAATNSSSRTNVYVYQPTTGRWQRVPLVAIDTANHLATARAAHFSVYAAIESALDLEVELSPTDEDGPCARGLFARAWVDSPLEQVELSSLNNLPEALRAKVAGDAPSVQDLLAVPGFTGSLRAVQVFELVQGVGESEVLRTRSVIATTLYVAADGTATVTHSDALGNVFGKATYPQPLLALTEIADRLRGGATGVSFPVQPADDLGLGARLHLLYFADDASAEPINAEDLGIAAVERAPLFELAGGSKEPDSDCDGLVDSYDQTDDRLVANVAASPRAVVDMLGGDSVQLAAHVANGTPTSETWMVLDGEGATLARVDGHSDTRTFSATAADRYLVGYTAMVEGRVLEHVFAIDVHEAPAQNTPPTCRPTRDLDVGRVGDAFALSAVLADAETPVSALRLQWGLLDGDTLVSSSMISERADKAVFAPLDAGNFELGCRAYDGVVWGPIGRVKVSVVPRAQNRAPSDLTLSPAASVLKVGDTLQFHASAKDPDGDVLQFNWTVDGTSAQGITRGNESVFSFTATVEGSVKVAVDVTDANEASVSAAARVVVGTLPMGTLDADKDGWNAGTGATGDCNDNDPSVHPGATDVCGDGIDSDCNGVAKETDCDNDGFIPPSDC